MSVNALNWALTEAQTDGAGQSAVLMFIAYRSDRDGFGRWPAAKIGAQIGIKEQQVRRHMSALIKAGHLVRVKRQVRGDGTLGAWLYWVPFKARPAVLPDGKPWHDAAERDVSSIKIGASDKTLDACAQPVDEHVDNVSQPELQTGLKRHEGTGQFLPCRNDNSLNDKSNSIENVTHIDEWKRNAS